MEAEVLQTRSASPTRQSRILQLRNARFRAAPGPLQPSILTAEAASFLDPDSSPNDELDHANSHHAMQKPSVLPSDTSPIGVLQEIRNSSMRRRKRNGEQMHDLVEPAADEIQDEGKNAGLDAQEMSSYDLNGVPEIARAKTTLRPPPRREYQRPSLGRSSRSTIVPRRVCSNETSLYIEYLESQVVSLQTQLQSLTSPSHTKTQTAKLRAAASEARLLEEEIAEWEQHFEVRLQEQVEQHVLVSSSLRSHVKALESEKASQTDKVKELEVESESKSRNLESLENANRELERRLNFLSELLAGSPTKLNLNSSLNLKKTDPKASRRTWYAPAGGARGDPQRVGTTSPERRRSFQPSQPFPVAAGQSSTPRTPSLEHHANHFGHDNPIENYSSHRLSLDCASVSSQVSEATLVDSASGNQSPSKRNSLTVRSPTLENTSEARSGKSCTRRMRRFHTGAAGPRTLILPATTHAGTYPASAPVVGVTPTTESPEHMEDDRQQLEVCVESPNEFSTDNDVRTNGVLQRPPRRRRSSTWDGDESRANARRKQTLTAPSILSTLETDFSATENESSFVGSSESKEKRKHATNGTPFSSIRCAPGKSLFEELNRVRQDSETPEEQHGDSTLRPGLAAKQIDATPDHSHTKNACPAADDEDPRISIPCRPRSTKPLYRRISNPHDDTNKQVIRNPSTHPIDILLNTTLLTHVPPARTLFQHTYQNLISKPALELRWWLVSLLIGRVMYRSHVLDRGRGAAHGKIRERKTKAPNDGIAAAAARSANSPWEPSPPSQRTCSPHPSNTRTVNSNILGIQFNPSNKEHDVDDDSSLISDYVPSSLDESQKEWHPPVPAPVYWLRLGLTVAAALGIAVRDGPKCLLDDCRVAAGLDGVAWSKELEEIEGTDGRLGDELAANPGVRKDGAVEEVILNDGLDGEVVG
ncbi:MAG: hypothetical protein M1831_006417 [Alyxoria varia]|nr:MAG: hypothetical protein M1831_006417 [Alyxoria varia]